MALIHSKKKISFSINGREVYDCNYANQVINIKN